jgi:hypothetical protein
MSGDPLEPLHIVMCMLEHFRGLARSVTEEEVQPHRAFFSDGGFAASLRNLERLCPAWQQFVRASGTINEANAVALFNDLVDVVTEYIGQYAPLFIVPNDRPLCGMVDVVDHEQLLASTDRALQPVFRRFENATRKANRCLALGNAHLDRSELAVDAACPLQLDDTNCLRYLAADRRWVRVDVKPITGQALKCVKLLIDKHPGGVYFASAEVKKVVGSNPHKPLGRLKKLLSDANAGWQIETPGGGTGGVSLPTRIVRVG